MDEKELLQKIENQVKALVGDPDKNAEDIKTEFHKALTEATNGLISKEELDKKLDELTAKSSGLSKEKAEKLVKDVNDISIKIQSMQEESIKSNEKPKDLKDLIKDALSKANLIKERVRDDGSKIEYIDYFKDTGRKQTPEMTLKAAVDMTTALSYSGVEIGSPYKTTYDPSRVLIPLNVDIHAMDMFPVLRINDKYFGILVQATNTDGSGTTAENTAAGKSSITYETKEFKVHKINTLYHVSEEQFEDVEFLIDDMTMYAYDNIKSTFDEKVFSASGDGDTDIKGLFVSGNYTAFASGTTYLDSIEDADYLDAIGTMKLQANVANYSPNFVMLHPQKINEIEALKDLNANSKFNRSVKYDNMGNVTFIKGLRVVSSKKLGTDACYVGDTRAVKIGLRKDLNLIIGLDSDDLSTGMRTIVYGMRATVGVLHSGALVYTSALSTDVTNINKA